MCSRLDGMLLVDEAGQETVRSGYTHPQEYKADCFNVALHDASGHFSPRITENG
jgi:hypothetical protein